MVSTTDYLVFHFPKVSSSSTRCERKENPFADIRRNLRQQGPTNYSIA
jgi:hypothetical protein